MNQARDASGRFIKGQHAMQAAGAGGLAAWGGAFKSVAGIGMAAFSALKSGIASVGQSIRSLGTKLIPLTLIMGYGTKKAADFEQQMDAVGAITGATGSDMERLEKKAKLMGATTVFSATQSGEAMEYLGRAGATTDEIISGLSGVMSAAAADSIELGTAADIVARVLKSMNLGFDQANRVADVLALTSARTNTDITGLGEGFKYAAAQAKVLEIPLETTSALLGAAADAGLKGSIGGTSFTNMLVKLSKPGGVAKKFLKEYNIQMTKTADGGLDIVDVLKQINSALSQETDVVEKARLASELFGIRGAKAFNAISLSIKSGKLDQLVEQLGNAQGKAEEMAKRRLSNFKGQITLLKSALEGLAIETMGMFLQGLADNVKGVTEALGGVVQAMQDIKGSVLSLEELNKKYGATTVAVALGISEGLQMVVDGFALVKSTIEDIVQSVSGYATPEVTRSIAKWGTAFTVAAAVAAPFLIIIGSIIVSMAGILAIAIIFSGQIAALFAPVIASIAGIALWFQLSKAEGQTFQDWFFQHTDTMKKRLDWLKNEGFEPLRNYWELELSPTFDRAKDRIVNSLEKIKTRARSVFNDMRKAVEFLKPVFEVVFREIQRVGELAMEALAQGAVYASIAFKGTIGVLDGLLSVMQTVARVMITGVVRSIQAVAKAVVAAADAVDFTVSGKLRAFAEKDWFSFQAGEGGVTRSSAAITSHATGAITAGLAAQGGRGAAIPPGMSPQDAANALAAALKKGTAAGARKPDPCVDVSLNDNRKVSVTSKLELDGEELARSFAKKQVELQDRRGFRATPWQRRITLEHGATPITRAT